MKKLFLFLALAFILPLITASIGNLGTFKQGSCINLLQTCVDCTYNNISSVVQPDGVQAIGLVIMTQYDSEYIYPFCNTSKLGIYHVNGYGDAGSAKTKWNYNFEITPSGGSENNSIIFLFLIISAVAILLIAFMLRNHIFAVIAGFAMMGSGVYGMIYGFGDITSLYTRMISYIIIGLGMIITVTSGLELVKEIYDGTGSEKDEGDED